MNFSIVAFLLLGGQEESSIQFFGEKLLVHQCRSFHSLSAVYRKNEGKILGNKIGEFTLKEGINVKI